jgi:hypothetical protein
VANNNADIILDNIYIGNAPVGSPKGTVSLSTPCNADPLSRVATGCESVKKPMQDISKSVFSKYAVYRNGIKIAETASKTYTDVNLGVDTYTYYVKAMYIFPTIESNASNEVVVDITNVSSIEEVQSMHAALYPVPAKDKLNVMMADYNGSVNLEIYNLMGKIIYHRTVESMGIKQNEQIMLNDIVPGIYYLKISDRDKTNSIKFIKE